jgi:rhodanese-related sulfurtransferase
LYFYKKGGKKMCNRIFKVTILIVILIILSGITSGISIKKLKPQIGFTDITPEEAWDFLSDTINGIQIPIDVRSPKEWLKKRIDTPFPEDPRRYSDWTTTGLEEFVSLYNNSQIILYCRGGDRSNAAARHIVEETDFNGTIYNMLGGINQWIAEDFPTKYYNHNPDQPETPISLPFGTIDVSYTFSTSTIDSDDDSVRYGWSWNGDVIVEEWTPYHASGTVAEISHNWSVTGKYNISVVAEDNVGEQSIFSENFSILIKESPNPPIIKGEIEGAYDEEYEYTFSSFDPEDVNIYLYIEWGDGDIEEYIGPYQSGEEVILKHTYTEEGNYMIRAKAKDIYDIESDWSTLTVTMPKTLVITRPLLKFLEQYSYLFPLFRQLLLKY